MVPNVNINTLHAMALLAIPRDAKVPLRELTSLAFPLLQTYAIVHNCEPMPSFRQFLGVPADAHPLPVHTLWLVPQPELPQILFLLLPLAH